MKKLLLIALVGTAAYGMQEPLTRAKRGVPEELSDTELAASSSEKVQKIEDNWDETKRTAAQLSMSEKDILLTSLDTAEDQLRVSDLKKILEQAQSRAYTPGATQRAKLFNAAVSIKNVLLSHKLLIPLLMDKRLTGEIITRLAQAYRVSLPAAALAFYTDAAAQWIANLYGENEIKSGIFYELIDAANKGNRQVFDFFLKHAGNNAPSVINRSFDGINPLRRAVEKNDKKLVRKLLDVQGIELNELLESDGTTSLMHAAAHGYTYILKKLIQAGADLNLPSQERNTALLWAVKNKQPKSVKILVDAGADLNLQDEEGNTALMVAAKNNDQESLQLLIPRAQINNRNNKNLTALDYVVANRNVEAARALLNRGAVLFINDYDGDHNNPLITAVAHNDLPMVTELIVSGARFDVSDKQGNTPLMIAVQKNYTEIIKKLIRYDALPNNQDASLTIAAAKNDLNLIKMLIGARANINAQNRFGNTALMIALERGFDSIVQALLEAQADVNIQNNEGKTALMIAAKKGNASYVDQLIAAGARNEFKDASGKTAYQIAVDNGHVELLIKFPM